MSNKAAYIFGGCFFFVIGLAFFIAGCFMLKEQLTISKYVQIDAVIVDHSWHYEDDDDGTDYIVYNDIVEYEVDGVVYRKGCNYGGYRSEPNNIGDTRVVYYNPDNPSDVIFKTEVRTVLIVACFCAMILGTFMFVFLLRKGIKGEE